LRGGTLITIDRITITGLVPQAHQAAPASSGLVEPAGRYDRVVSEVKKAIAPGHSTCTRTVWPWPSGLDLCFNWVEIRNDTADAFDFEEMGRAGL